MRQEYKKLMCRCFTKFPEFAKITTNLTKGWVENKGWKFIRPDHKHLSAGIYKIMNSACHYLVVIDFSNVISI